MAIDLTSLNSIDSSQKYNPQATSIALQGQLSRSLLGSFPDTYSSGISSDLLYKVYDMRAISPGIMAAYLDKVKVSEDESAVADVENVKTEDNPEIAENVVYDSQLSEGRGYDLDALKKIQVDMDKFYSDPKNQFKDYYTVDVVA